MSKLFQSPETQMGLEALPPIDYDLNLRRTGAVLVGVSTIAFTGAALYSPEKAEATCNDISAGMPPALLPSDMSQPNFAGMEIVVIPRSIGTGSEFVCSKSGGLAAFDIQQNGDSLQSFNIDFIAPAGSGIELKIGFNQSTLSYLNCQTDTADPNIKHCQVNGLQQKQRNTVWMSFATTTAMNAISISASVEPTTINDVNPANNRSSIGFNVLSESSIVNQLGNTQPGQTTTNTQPIQKVNPYYSIKYGKPTRWIRGERLTRIRTAKCWQTPVNVKPLSPNSDSTKNVLLKSLSMTAPGSYSNQSYKKRFTVFPAKGVNIIVKACKTPAFPRVENVIRLQKNTVLNNVAVNKDIQKNVAKFNPILKKWITTTKQAFKY